jgi:hypothetical protein
LLRMVRSRSATISEVMYSVAQDLFFIAGYYDSLVSGEITVTDSFQANSVNAYTSLENPGTYPDTDRSVWF